jgi:hypothetical protein
MFKVGDVFNWGGSNKAVIVKILDQSAGLYYCYLSIFDLDLIASTTWWTSPRHHFPFGFLISQLQPLMLFSLFILSKIVERPFVVKSSSIFLFVYSKQ